MSETKSKNDLVTFAGSIFDLLLRLKAGIVQPSNDLRPKIASMLDEFEKRAERYRFNPKVVQVAKFGLAAFVDEAVLTNNFPLRDQWERNPLQLEYFGEQLAGEKFFDKLEAMLGQIEVTQDAVEVYYVCMLLGFKGKYAVYEKDKLARHYAADGKRAGQDRKNSRCRTFSALARIGLARAARRTQDADVGKSYGFRGSRTGNNYLFGNVSGVVKIFGRRDAGSANLMELFEK